MPNTCHTITLGELKDRFLDQIRNLPADTEITFGGGLLSVYRLKPRLYRADNKTPQILDIEFCQVFTVDIDPNRD